MPRTAPTITYGSETFLTVSISLIDDSGDVRTESLQVPTGTPDTEVEALVAALAAITNSSVYRVAVSQVFNSIADPQNANATPVNKSGSVYDNLVILAKNNINDAKRGYIPAPVGTLFIGDTDEIDPASVPLGNYLTALLAVLPAGFDIISARYTERREINTATKI